MVRRAISNIRNVLTQQQTEIVSIAGMLMVIGLITKFFGLLFNSVAAGNLGADAYNSFIFASNIPELISQIILFGTISASVLPMLSMVLEEKGRERFERVFSTVINLSLLFFIVFSFIVALTADITLPWFIKTVIHPETPIEAEEMKEIIKMLRVLMIPQVILALSIYLSTALNLFERFLVPQLAPLFYNLGRIISIFIFLPILGKSPWVLVLGTLIGSLLHLAIQIPLMRPVGIKYKLFIDVKDYYVHKIGVVAAPRVLSMSAEQIGVTVDKFIAFGLVGKSLAYYNLAISVISVPLSLIGGSFTTASFPILTRAFNRNDRILAAQIFMRIFNQILFLSIPAAVLLLVLRVPVARLFFGMFGSEINFLDTYSIAWAIMFFAPGIVFESLRPLLYRTFYAAHDTIRPLIVTVFVLAAGGVTGLLFSYYFSHFNHLNVADLTFNPEYFLDRKKGIAAVGGLALSSTIVFTIEALVMMVWLNKLYLHLPASTYFKAMGKKLLAGAIMAAFTYFTYKIWASLETNERTLPLLVLTFTTTASAAMVYIGTCGLLKIDEVEVYIQFLSKHPNWKSLKQAFRRFRRFDPIPEKMDY